MSTPAPPGSLPSALVALRSNKPLLFLLAGALGGAAGSVLAEFAPDGGPNASPSMLIVATGLWSAIAASVLATALFAVGEWHQHRDVRPRSVQKILLFGALARCVFAERKADRVDRLLALIAGQPKLAVKRQLALLDGVLAAAVASRKPVKFPQEPPVLEELKKLSGTALQSRVAKLDAALVWPGKPGVPPEPVIPPLSSEQQAQFDLGRQLFTSTCAACHQPHGLGMEGLAPPLADSEWVLGSEQRLIRIVLHGVSGPLRVKGAGYNLDMPAMGVFDDAQVAAILTYLRREWEHGVAPVAPATARQIRQQEAKRQDAWRQEELLKVP